MTSDFYDDMPDESADVNWDDTDVLPPEEPRREPIVLPKQPLFETLFRQAVKDDDPVLKDFAQYVVGPLSDHFGLLAAKGGAFFRMKEAEGAQNTERYARDQTLRAHLINGMLPALHVARLLHGWGSHRLREWDVRHERLFIAGYMLHDFTKIPAAQKRLEAAGFSKMDAPSERQIPVLRDIFREWCHLLGLADFLAPIGTIDNLVDDLLYIATNTQRLSGRAASPHLLSPHFDSAVSMAATEVSHFADLIAYVAPSPREAVSHETIQKAMTELAYSREIASRRVAKLSYHHVAENRGLLLNFIHNAVIEALTDEARVPILYAPSGVVYLERHDAPALPDFETLVKEVVRTIREKAGQRLISSGKGAKRGNVSLQIDNSYNDFFDLRDLIRHSHKLVQRYIKNNKTADRLAPVIAGKWLGDEAIPDISTDPKDARYDQIAEWAGFLEKQFQDRFDIFDFTSWALANLGLADARASFDVIRNYPVKGGGIKFWWFWASVEALKRQTLNDIQVLELLANLSHQLADELPADLPASAQVNVTTWEDLTAYVAQVLSIGGGKSALSFPNEAVRYTRAKTGRGGAACALCGGDYATRKPTETAVAFQPGVYTGRIKMGASENARNLCSICALEQLLRQLFIDNLDTGGTAEGQRVRYLTFYPSYFFTPETLRFIKQAYRSLRDIRISDKDLRRVLTHQGSLADVAFWQRLEPFLLRSPEEEPSKRLLRYHDDAQATFFMVGFRNFNDPTDTESWIVPVFLALVLSVCLDVKVIASDSGIPLLLESAEMRSTHGAVESGDVRETLWFEGVQAAVQAVLQETRVCIDDVLPTLARLTAAYMIHLDTEYAPPKENWQRFVPIANALMESPLYVFHYLKKQERDGKQIGRDQILRYIRYAEDIFNPQGDPLMSHAKTLVGLYRQFYRAKTITNTNSILRPLSVVSDALLSADMRLFSDAESLYEVAYGELYRFMDRVSKGLADGRFPKGVSVPEREAAMRDFCRTFVQDVFIDVFKGDVAALRGRQLNLLRSACDVLYREAQQSEWAARGQDIEDTDDTPSETTDL